MKTRSASGIAHAEHHLGAAAARGSGYTCSRRWRAPRAVGTGDATGDRTPTPRPRMACSTATTASATPRSRSASTCWVAAATSASPSAGCGERARAMPSWPPWATTRQPLLSSRALVAMTPMVVLVSGVEPRHPLDARPRTDPHRGTPPRCAAGAEVEQTRGRMVPSSMSPVAFTASRAATTVAVASASPRRYAELCVLATRAACRRWHRCPADQPDLVRAVRAAAGDRPRAARAARSDHRRRRSTRTTRRRWAPPEGAVGNPTPSASSCPSPRRRRPARTPTLPTAPRRRCRTVRCESQQLELTAGRRTARTSGRRHGALENRTTVQPVRASGSVQCPPSTSVITAHATRAPPRLLASSPRPLVHLVLVTFASDARRTSQRTGKKGG